MNFIHDNQCKLQNERENVKIKGEQERKNLGNKHEHRFGDAPKQDTLFPVVLTSKKVEEKKKKITEIT